MANKPKKGLDYFPMDVTIFNDIKIRKLIKYQGGQSISVYAYLLCKIFSEGYYIKWDDELPFVISEATGCNEAYIQEVFKCAVNIGLFSKKLYAEKGVITSKGIQERYAEISKQAKRKFQIDEFNLINSEELNENSEEMANNTEGINNNSEELPQSKVKEIKEEKSKVKIAKVIVAANGDQMEMKALKKEYFELIQKFEKERNLDFWEFVKKFIREKKPKFPEPYFDAWNFFAIKFRIIKENSSMTEQRLRKFYTRIDEPGFDFIKILECIQKSRFLKGDNDRGWKVSISFILESQENYNNIIEGNKYP